jgi:hypothetical protein
MLLNRINSLVIPANGAQSTQERLSNIDIPQLLLMPIPTYDTTYLHCRSSMLGISAKQPKKCLYWFRLYTTCARPIVLDRLDAGTALPIISCRAVTTLRVTVIALLLVSFGPSPSLNMNGPFLPLGRVTDPLEKNLK